MMSKFPKWFWFSIVTFIIISWLFSVVAHFSSEFLIVNFDWYVGYSLFYFGLLSYPIFFVVMLISLFKKIELNSDEKVWAFIFLLIPFATNLPIFNPLIFLT
ncbi:hypothetical protein CEY16_03830 [Halalkalibacillus sediminis]|uniref:Uncharacterized protein n=1 Tax=Halalkalibacillus sediminis TaxID=2018042 RepID=A0A2I0QX25_9BACI|nr:hypothetical protein CEY16_03830 [Halalkalibacillus sediminis]